MNLYQSHLKPSTKHRNDRRLVLPEALEPRWLLAANPVITEFMAVNQNTLLDGDLQDPDWLEVFNAGDQSIDLVGWHLTDDPFDFSKWTFPNEVLDPGEYLVVFASNKSGMLPDSRDIDGNLHTNFRLAGENGYLALVKPDGITVNSEFGEGGGDYPTQVADVSYGLSFGQSTFVALGAPANVLIPSAADDASYGISWQGGDEVAFQNAGGLAGWTSGTGTGVGYDTSGTFSPQIGTNVDALMRGVSSTVYARVPFEVNDVNEFAGLTMPITYDDGFAAFVNGVEVARRCVPTVLSYDASAERCGGGPSFPAAVLDFDAEVGVSTSGNQVTDWTAVTGQTALPHGGHSFRRPTLATNVFADGQSGVFFDGSNDILNFDDANLPTGDYTIGLVWQPLNIGSSRSSIFSWGNDLENHFMNVSPAHHTVSGGSGRLILRFNGSDANSSIPAAGSVNGTSYATVISRSGNTYTFDVSNGVVTEQDVLVNASSKLALENGRIGNMIDPGNNDFNNAIFGGYIGRILVFNGALDGGERQSLMDQLMEYVSAGGPPAPAGPFTEEIDITPHLGALQSGSNILAIQGLNLAANDSDFLLAPELHASSVSLSVGSAGYFAEPTPGAANLQSFPSLAATPVASVPAGVYGESGGLLNVTLTTASPSADIHFTTDGSEPDQNSTLYSGPIAMNASTLLRARAYDVGLAPSEVLTESYIVLATAVESFHSDLPIVVLDSMGRSIPGTLSQSQASLVTAVIDTSVATGRAAILDTPDFVGRAGMRVRGNASSSYAKKPYAFETWDGDGNDMDVPLLGLPAESDWVLNATWMDRTLVRDILMFQLWGELGYYTPHFRPVEVYLNTGGGKVTSDDYWGIYIVQDKVKRGPDRVDIEELLRSHTTEPDISGGYILQDDRRRFGDQGISSEAGVAGAIAGVIFHEPNEQELTAAQVDWVQEYFSDFETALFGSNFDDPVDGYAKYIDVDAWVEYHILEEFSFNTDAFGASVFMTLDRSGKLTAGPVWDFDGALANSVEFQSYNPQGYIHTQLIPKDGPTAYPWWPRLFQDSDFEQKWIDGWHRLRQTVLDETHLHNTMDAFADQLRESQERNFDAWSMKIGENVLTRNMHERSNLSFPTWQAHVDHLKQYISDRLVWLDTNFVTAPKVSPGGDVIASPTQVTISAPSGTIYYTLDGTDPRLPANSTSGSNLISPHALMYDGGSISISTTTTVKARALVGTNWSGLEEQEYIAEQPATALNLALGEINFNPHDPDVLQGDLPGSNNDDYEFVEFVNKGGNAINLSNVQFTDGIDFTFGNVVLVPGQRVVVVKNQAAFEARYGTGINVAGVFAAGGLSNAGEQLKVIDATGTDIVDFSFDDNDPWPERADGHGGTLELNDVNTTLNADYRKWYHWRGSTEYGGSPGTAGVGPLGVVVNEVLTNTTSPVVRSDSIELLNTSTGIVNLGGWYLSDSSNQYLKYEIPAGTTLNPGQYLVFDEGDFNPTPLAPGPDDFALSGSAGDDVWLFAPDGGGSGIPWIIDDVHFEAASNGETFGRFPNGIGRFTPLLTETLGTQNSVPRVGPLVISEVQYHPSSPSALALELDSSLSAEDLEFVEIYNPTSNVVVLDDWRLRGGIDFEFAETSELAPGALLLVVPFDPQSPENASRLAAFRMHYSIAPSVDIVGPYAGQLSNNFDRIEMQRPGVSPVEGSGMIPRLVEDEIVYDDATPWPTTADGDGDALHRHTSTTWGGEASSWSAAPPNPGVFDRAVTAEFPTPVNPIGEVGQITTATHAVQTVLLSQSYLNPVVLAQSVSFVGTDVAVARVANVQADRFDLFLAEPSNLNGIHGVGETVHYVVVEAGNHVLPNGTRLEAGTIDTNATVGIRVVSPSLETVSFATPFSTNPVILSQPQTTNGLPFLKTRQDGIGMASFQVALEQEEAVTNQHVTETVGYFALEPGKGSWNGLLFESLATATVVRNNFETLGFQQPYATAPRFIASVFTRNGIDNAHLRYQNLTATNVDVKVEEDTTHDTETTHTSESVGYLAFGGDGQFTAVDAALPDGQSLSFSLNIVEARTVIDVDVSLHLLHEQVDDLDILLESPTGTVVELLSDVGGRDLRYTTLDDQANTSIVTGTAPFSGQFQPEGILDSYRGETANGVWQLHVNDDTLNGLTGTLVDWSLDIQVAPAVTGNVNYDGQVDAKDIDMAYANLETDNPVFDLDHDGDNDANDVSHLVTNILGKRFGDTDLDTDVDIADFTRLVRHFDPLGLVKKTWAEGDFDGDGDVDIVDFNMLVTNFAPVGYLGASTAPMRVASPVSTASTVSDTVPIDDRQAPREVYFDSGVQEGIQQVTTSDSEMWAVDLAFGAFGRRRPSRQDPALPDFGDGPTSHREKSVYRR